MLEFEKKILLSKEEYELLLPLSDITRITVQTNYYYDDDKFSMNEKGITNRIREKKGKYKATIKNHSMFLGECNLELSQTVTSQNDDAIFTQRGLKNQGYLITERRVIFSDNDIKAVLDKNTYLGVEDYELEIEFNPQKENEATKKIREYANIISLNYDNFNAEEFCRRTDNSVSKSTRFFERKKEIKESSI